MASYRAPKQWVLTKIETITSFESWEQNLLYLLALDPNFAVFLEDGFKWKKKSSACKLRGFEDDSNTIPEESRRTAHQKVAQLDLMLGQIANYCPVIARNQFIKDSTSLAEIWQKIRLHYGFQSSGSHFLDLSMIKLNIGERPEDLFQRLMAFFEDNLMLADSGISHHGSVLGEDEDISPSLENVSFLWLQLVHPSLPQLIKQRYGSELRNKSIASIKPEISQALPSLLEELHNLEESRAMRTFTSQRGPRPMDKNSNRKFSFKSCTLCKAANRDSFNTHNLVNCRFLSEFDKKSISRARLIGNVSDDDDDWVDEEGITSPAAEHAASVDVSSPPKCVR